MKGGLVIEMELVNSYQEPLVSNDGANFDLNTNTSEQWSLENCQIKGVFEQVRDRTLEVLTATTIDQMKNKR